MACAQPSWIAKNVVKKPRVESRWEEELKVNDTVSIYEARRGIRKITLINSSGTLVDVTINIMKNSVPAVLKPGRVELCFCALPTVKDLEVIVHHSSYFKGMRQITVSSFGIEPKVDALQIDVAEENHSDDVEINPLLLALQLLGLHTPTPGYMLFMPERHGRYRFCTSKKPLAAIDNLLVPSCMCASKLAMSDEMFCWETTAAEIRKSFLDNVEKTPKDASTCTD